MKPCSFIMAAPALLVLLAASACSRDAANDTTQDQGGAASPSGAPADSTPAAPATDTPAAPAGDATSAGATPAGAGGAADGAQVFQQYCQTCHGPQGEGDGPAAAALNPKPASFATGEFRLDPNGNGTKGEVEDITAVVQNGAAKYGGSPLMAPWPMLSPEQMQAVAQHVKSLGGA